MTSDDQKATSGTAAETAVQSFRAGLGEVVVGSSPEQAHDNGVNGSLGCPPADQAAAEEVAGALIQLDLAVHISLRYHAQRRAWFDGLHRLSMVLSAVGGSAALASVLTAGHSLPAPNSLVLIIALTVTLAGALSVAFGFSERARTANDLYRRFAALAHQMAAHPAPGTAELRTWKAERLMIEADEPPIISVLNVLCHNAEMRARGYGDEHRFRVRWWQRLCANVISLPPTDWHALAG